MEGQGQPRGSFERALVCEMCRCVPGWSQLTVTGQAWPGLAACLRIGPWLLQLEVSEVSWSRWPSTARAQRSGSLWGVTYLKRSRFFQVLTLGLAKCGFQQNYKLGFCPGAGGVCAWASCSSLPGHGTRGMGSLEYSASWVLGWPPGPLASPTSE